MTLFYFDFKMGSQTFRDQSGGNYADVEAAWRDVRSALMEMAQCGSLSATDYEITLRVGMKPIRRARLAFTDEFLDGNTPALVP